MSNSNFDAQPWFDDLYPGFMVTSQPRFVPEREIVDFARLWDPQPYHIDTEAAKSSVFGRLVGSGTHMHALTMRLGVDSNVLCGKAVLGLGLDRVRYLKPLLPDTSVAATFAVTDARLSASRPGYGVVTWEVKLLDEAGEAIYSAVLANLYRRRP